MKSGLVPLILGNIIGVPYSAPLGQDQYPGIEAAVKAALAGEHGRGFAVAAAEARNMAQRSAAAAKEIKTLIDDSVEKVDYGSHLVAQAGSMMDEVVASVKRVTAIMSEISAASHEQSSGIDQVNLAISQMDEVTQQNAALVEQAAALAESLQGQAANLAQVVSVFKLDNQQLAEFTARQSFDTLGRRCVAPETENAGRKKGYGQHCPT